MNDQDYIRKAVELADNFKHRLECYWGCGDQSFGANDQPRWFLDALAAQLVRQVDNQIGSWVEVSPTQTRAYGNYGDHKTDGPDRTMNSIKAIVDSGVLEQSDE